MKYLLIPIILLGCGGTKTGTQTETTTTNSSVIVTDTVPKVTNIPAADTMAVNPGSNSGTTIPKDKIAVYFGSMASGPIGDDFLKEWLVKFNKEEKAAITADKFSACGKEGEYIIVIYKNGFDNTLENKFTSGLEKVIKEEVTKRKAENPSSGSVEIRQNPNLEEYTYCRLGSKKWL